MPGGLLQLVGRGAQDQLITGNPSFTQFRSVYKRHTDFAMEHFRLYFKTTILSYPASGTLTLRTKVERYAQLLSDCYLSITLPDIFSGINIQTNSRTEYNFQWVRNIGYNMINYVSVLVNGQEIVRHTGEWMKLYANLEFDANKRAILDRMVGNIPELYDPANANGNNGIYPVSLTTQTNSGQVSIYGRTLQIPLHFWFCESIGKALPLVALQYSDVEIVVELANMYTLFTTIDVDNTSSTFGTRISPDPTNSLYQMTKFLSPEVYNSTANTIPDLRTWNINPYIEANYIFVSDAEASYIARTDHSFLIKQIDVKSAGKQYGASNDLELVMRNLCTRIIWVFQRDDLKNQPDNYTNWQDPYISPNVALEETILLPSNVTRRDILLESSVILDTQERFATKQVEFFRDIQPYRHSTGNPISGVYLYSFQLDNTDQPSGSLNGSMFNRTLLRNTLITPPYTTNVANGTGILQQCVLKSTVNQPNPTIVDPNAKDNSGRPLYTPDQLVTIITKAPNTVVYQYTYNVRAYTESYNFLRIVGGIGNVVFSS
jgi:hypothetical protein